MLQLFSIVSLTKPRYNKKNFDALKDGDKPRLLIVKAFPKWDQYLAKYPSGRTQIVNIHDITDKGIFTTDNPGYARIAKTMRAVTLEFKQNPKYREYLKRTLPKLALDLEQRIEANNNAALEKMHEVQQPPTIIEPPSLDVFKIPEAPKDGVEERTYNVLLGIHDALWAIVKRME